MELAFGLRSWRSLTCRLWRGRSLWKVFGSQRDYLQRVSLLRSPMGIGLGRLKVNFPPLQSVFHWVASGWNSALIIECCALNILHFGYCKGSETFVKKRAEVWDKNVSWVMDKLKLLLTVVQPGIAYHLTGMLDNHRKVLHSLQYFPSSTASDASCNVFRRCSSDQTWAAWTAV